jgi:hypothetical protein
VSCDKHFAILELINGELHQIGSLANIHDNEICDFEFRGDHIYSTAFNEPLIKATKLNLEPKPLTTSVIPVTVAPKPKGTQLRVDSDNSNYDQFFQSKVSALGQNLTGLEKITTSVDGRYLFCGGKGLNRFAKVDGDYQPEFVDVDKQFVFYGMKATNSGNLVLQEATTNNMVVLDSSNFNIEETIAGEQKCAFNARYLRNPHFVGEDNTVVWFCGTSKIGVMNFDNLEPAIYDDVIPCYDQSIGIATRVIAKNQGTMMLIVYLLNNSFYLTTLLQGKTIMNTKVNKFLNNFSKIYSLEMSKNKNIVFCAGTTPKDSNKVMYGTLAALSFEGQPKILSNRTFGNFNFNKCSALRRFKDRDDLVVGCHKHVLIVEYVNEKFMLRNIVYDVHNGAVSDVWIRENFIFSVCKDDDFVSEMSFNY